MRVWDTMESIQADIDDWLMEGRPWVYELHNMRGVDIDVVYERLLETYSLDITREGDSLFLRPSQDELVENLHRKMVVWDDHIFNTDSLPIEEDDLMGYSPYEAVRIMSDTLERHRVLGWLPSREEEAFIGRIMFGGPREYPPLLVEELDWVVDAEGIAWLENGSVRATN